MSGISSLQTQAESYLESAGYNLLNTRADSIYSGSYPAAAK